MLTGTSSSSTTKTENTHPKCDFLSCGNPSPKDKIEEIGNKEIGIVKKHSTPQLLHDIETLTPTELRKKYPRTYKCWDNMKQRKHMGAIIHPEFNKFSDFLRHVGPCEDTQYTLDRINNDDPEYAPGKVEWRDKYAQNSNKGNNIFLTHDDGRKHTIAQWAKITKQNPSSLYKRHKNGWSDMEVITGNKSGQDISLLRSPWPYETRAAWEKRYVEAVIDKGYSNTKLHFLRNVSREKYYPLLRKKEMLKLAIQKREGFDDYNAEGAFEAYVYDNGYSLQKFKDTALPDLHKKLQEVSKEVVRWRNIFTQADKMVEYITKKQQVMKSKSALLPNGDILSYLHSLYPKPEYTLHLPPKGNVQ